MVRVVQGRLQQLAENVLPESQCGFRRGRGCTDLIFTVGQLIEKSNEHRAKVFLIFIDLCKAYDSIPREALWTALAKPGIPDSLLGIIRAFHQGMKAAVRIDKTLLEEFDVNNGLRQGCCMAPALFNLYACLVTERWAARMEGVGGVGVHVRHKLDGKLFRRYLRSACESCLTECQFADDTALLATTREGAEEALQWYVEVARDFGLTVSATKTKVMVCGRQVVPSDRVAFHIDSSYIEVVEEFPYLGSVVSTSGRAEPDVEKRVAQASKAFSCLRKAVFKDRDLTVRTKRSIYQACVTSVVRLPQRSEE